MSVTPKELVKFLLPHVSTAGAYSTRIQQRTAPHTAKTGETAFQQALSDADLSIQAFLEVVLLSRFPELSFFSEEQEQSLNVKYFPSDAEWEVLLDPIDGTRAYLDNADNYQIIVTLHNRESIVAAICHCPKQDRCYVGIRGEGTQVFSSAEMESGAAAGQKVNLSDKTRRVVLFNAPEVREKLSRHFEVIDIVEEYRKTGTHRAFTEIFKGKVAACIHTRPQLIDAGAIGFIAEQAGAVQTDLTGKPLENFRAKPTRRLESGLIVSATPAFQRDISEALGR